MLRRHEELVTVVNKNSAEAAMIEHTLSPDIAEALAVVYKQLDQNKEFRRGAVGVGGGAVGGGGARRSSLLAGAGGEEDDDDDFEDDGDPGDGEVPIYIVQVRHRAFWQAGVSAGSW